MKIRWIFCVVLVLSERGFAVTRTVDRGDASAHQSIQEAMDACDNGDVVSVAAGEYSIVTPLNFRGKGITVKSKLGEHQTTIRMKEKTWEPPDNSVVVFRSGEDGLSVLEGFTLAGGTGCKASTNDPTQGGGVFFGSDCSPILRFCIIEDNSAHEGGGVFCDRRASPRLIGCKIRRNRAGHGSGWGGGGVFCVTDSSASFESTHITENYSKRDGGGAYFRSCSPSLTGCRILQNRALGEGGGVYFYGGEPGLTGCLVSQNAAHSGGGLSCRQRAAPVLTHCTVSGNAGGIGGGLFCEESEPEIVSSILWDNAGGCVVVEAGNGGREPKVSYSCVESGTVWSGTGNINTDPGFCGWPEAVLYVDASAPGIGSGTQADPFSRLDTALQRFNYCLSGTSPCFGTGVGGSNMGMTTKACECSPVPKCKIVLRPGKYPLGGSTLAHHATVEGAVQTSQGIEDAVIEGTLWGLRSGCSLSWVTVRNGDHGGVHIGDSEAPEVRNCCIRDNTSSARGGGLCGYGCAQAVISHCDIVSNDAYLGGGLYLREATATVEHCTISGNIGIGGGGVYLDRSEVTIDSCIVWDNPGGAIAEERSGESVITVAYSCVESGEPWDGPGNIADDPQFCGWPQGEVHVDAGAAPAGTGTEASPYARLEEALTGFSYCLAATSPCLRAGKGGSDMGRGEPPRQCAPVPARTVRLAAGTYAAEVFKLRHMVSLLGSGVGSAEVPGTDLEGTLIGLQSGGGISELEVTKGTRGGVRVPDGESPQIVNCRVFGNDGYVGGGIYCGQRSGPTIQGCVISANYCNGLFSKGGGLYCDEGAEAQVIDCQIFRNGAYDGGGIYLDDGSQARIEDCDISMNDAARGGGVYCSEESEAEVVRSVIDYNDAEESGGGVYCDKSDVGFYDSAILGNWSGSLGGGLFCWHSEPRIERCRIERNRAGGGAGMWSSFSSPNCIASRFSENSARDKGGGICFVGDSTPYLENCMVVENDADGAGGGVEFDGNLAIPLFVNCTISRNEAGSFGGLHWDSIAPCAAMLKNSIVWGNSPDSVCGQLDHCFTHADGDPLFVDADGGDFHLTEGSPCVDAGTGVSAPDIDFEGEARPRLLLVDMGADEYWPLFLRGDSDSNGVVNLTDSVFTLQALFLGGEPIGCLKAADTDDNGAVELTDAVYALNHLFKGGAAMAAPFPECGRDETRDSLTCDIAPSCQ